jgi:hypothetical protein
MNTKTEIDKAKQTRQLQMALNFFMVSMMLTCFALILQIAIRMVYPFWGRYWFPIFTFLLTFISLFVRYFQRTSPQFFEQKVLFVTVEIILILLLAKLISMISIIPMGWAVIWQDIKSWSDSLLQNFFNLDFLFRASGLLLIWLLTWLFSLPLNQLEEDEGLMEQEKLGHITTDRYRARQMLIRLVFNIGIVMIIMMVFIKSNLFVLPDIYLPSGILLTILLVYFFTSFMFLAINQYAIMKARWYLNDIKVKPDLAKHWIYYSLIFLISVILLIVFLPKDIPLDITTFAQWIADAITLIVSIIISIVLIPFAFVMAIIERLFSDATFDEPFEPIIPEMADILPQSVLTVPWWDVVKTILFWLIFIALIIFAITYYLNNRPKLLLFLRDLHLTHWFGDFWKWFLKSFQQAQKATTETIQTGLRKIQVFLQSRQFSIPKLIDLTQKLPPRQTVIHIYADWIHWNGLHGIERHSGQTPMEYAQVYGQHMSQDVNTPEQLRGLTNIFITARYSHHPIEKAQAQDARNLSNLLKQSLLAKQDQRESQ